MKFENRSGCKLLSISLCDEREYLGLSLHNRSFGAVTRIRLDAMSGPKTGNKFADNSMGE